MLFSTLKTKKVHAEGMLLFLSLDSEFSGRVLDVGVKDCWFETHCMHCVWSLSKRLYLLLNTGSTQEDCRLENVPI